MDKQISELNEHTDTATKTMLQKVVDKKRKMEKLKRNHLILLWATMISGFAFVVYLYNAIIEPYSYSFAVMFSIFVSNIIHLYFLIVVIGCYGFMHLLQEKRDKAEVEFHALRCEIIDKSNDLWGDTAAWQNRHLVFEMMKKHYDINLYYESK